MILRARPTRSLALSASPFALAAALLLLPAAGRAAEAPKTGASHATLHIEVEGADGENVDLHLSSGWLGALISTASIDCDADADRDARRMMESLREQGEGGVWKDRDRDGDQVLARRAKGMLKIQTTETGGDRSYLEMPWEVAECLMLGIEPAGDLGRRIASGAAKFRIQVEDRDGGGVRFAIE
jgi:hypothetical protein